MGAFSFSSEDLVLSLEGSSCFLRLGVLSWSCCHCVESLLWQTVYGAGTFSLQGYVCICLAVVPEPKFSVASEMHPLMSWGTWDIAKCPAGLDATYWKRQTCGCIHDDCSFAVFIHVQQDHRSLCLLCGLIVYLFWEVQLDLTCRKVGLRACARVRSLLRGCCWSCAVMAFQWEIQL